MLFTSLTWYIGAGNDRMINPGPERTLAKKMKATTTTLASSEE